LKKKDTMNTIITWHGHANFQLACGDLNILIDPFFTSSPTADCAWEEAPRPDLVLLTHLHGDHLGDAIALCRKHGASLGAVVGAGEALVRDGLPAGLLLNGTGFNIGGSLSFKGATITMTEATHTSEAGAPAGFIISLPDGLTVHHAGDTGIFSNMKTWGELYTIDVTLLPAGGVFTMDARQAALAASFLRAKVAIPMHWGTFPALARHMRDFPSLLAQAAPACKAVLLEPGRSFDCAASGRTHV
jgi:L-ascorbate metabolism protein UlaG (beta-lactamase superfamily)